MQEALGSIPSAQGFTYTHTNTTQNKIIGEKKFSWESIYQTNLEIPLQRRIGLQVVVCALPEQRSNCLFWYIVCTAKKLEFQQKSLDTLKTFLGDFFGGVGVGGVILFCFLPMFLLFETGSHYIVQTGLELPGSSYPPASASHSRCDVAPPHLAFSFLSLFIDLSQLFSVFT